MQLKGTDLSEMTFGLPAQLVEKRIRCNLKHKPLVLLHLIRGCGQGDEEMKKVLCFTNSKDSTHRSGHWVDYCIHKCLFQFEIEVCHLSILISGGWNREVPLYTEVSSFQEVEIKGSTVYRGVLISEGWNRGIPLYTEGVLIF